MNFRLLSANQIHGTANYEFRAASLDWQKEGFRHKDSKFILHEEFEIIFRRLFEDNFKKYNNFGPTEFDPDETKHVIKLLEQQEKKISKMKSLKDLLKLIDYNRYYLGSDHIKIDEPWDKLKVKIYKMHEDLIVYINILVGKKENLSVLGI